MLVLRKKLNIWASYRQNSSSDQPPSETPAPQSGDARTAPASL